MFKKGLKLVLKIFESLLFIVVILLFVLMVSPLLPIKGVPRSFIVVSGSMEPTIQTGSVAFTKQTDPKTLKVGDIIVYISPKNPKDIVIHRIITQKSTDPYLFETKGDHNSGADPWDVSDTQIKGRYLGSIPYLGYLGSFVRKPVGFILIIGFPALFYIFSIMASIKKGINEEIETKVANKIAKQNNPITKLFIILFAFSLILTPSLYALLSDTVMIKGIKIATSADYTDVDEKNCKEFKEKEDDHRKEKHEHDEDAVKGKNNKDKDDWFRNKYGKKNFQKEKDEFDEFKKCKDLDKKHQGDHNNDGHLDNGNTNGHNDDEDKNKDKDEIEECRVDDTKEVVESSSSNNN